jgi:hypothetical protein
MYVLHIIFSTPTRIPLDATVNHLIIDEPLQSTLPVARSDGSNYTYILVTIWFLPLPAVLLRCVY